MRLRPRRARTLTDRHGTSRREPLPVGCSIPFHAARARLPTSAPRCARDLIGTRQAARAGAERRAGVLREPLSDRKLYARNRSQQRRGQAMPLTAPSLTLGIEEEYLLVDPSSRDLVAAPPKEFMQRCEQRLGAQVTHEVLQ